MKRVFFALAFLACSQAPDVTTTVPKKPIVDLQVPPVVSVVRGETTSVDVTVFAADGSTASIIVTTGPLPEGVSCAPVTIAEAPMKDVALSCSASADAPTTEIPVDVVVMSEGKIIGSAGTLLDVSAVAGSFDPTFGDGGVVLLPDGTRAPVAIGITQDGTIVVVGYDANQVFVERFAPNETPSPPWRFGDTPECTAAAIAADGRVVLAMTNISRSDLLAIDATNTVIRSLPNQNITNALAWDDDSFFFANTTRVFRAGDTSNADVDVELPVNSLEVIAPGKVIAAGQSSDHVEIATVTRTGDTLTAAPSLEVPTPGASVVIATTATTSFGTLVAARANDGNGSSVWNVGTGGAVSSTYSRADGFAMHLASFAGLPILVGDTQLSTGLTSIKVGFVDGFDVSFGALGHTYLSLGATTSITSSVIDPTNRYLYVAGITSSDTNVVRGFVGRVRITSTP